MGGVAEGAKIINLERAAPESSALKPFGSAPQVAVCTVSPSRAMEVGTVGITDAGKDQLRGV